MPTKLDMSPKTDEIMGNSGTATAVPDVPGAAPLDFLSSYACNFWNPYLKDRLMMK